MTDQDRGEKVVLFDSHAHLGFEDYAEDLAGVLDRARASGVQGVITVGSGGGARAHVEARALARSRDGIWATAGLHPHDASEGGEELLAELSEAAAEEVVVAVGETGLDYHYDYSPREEQRRVFQYQLELARELGKPVVVHTREADDDTLAILRESGAGLPGVIHCFSGDPAFAEAVVDLGLHVSFSGIVTFPKAAAVQEAAKIVPDGRLLVETDSPFLSPAPKRGRRNEPARVRLVAEKVAELRGVTLADVGRITSTNTWRLFGVGGATAAPIAYPIRDQLYLNLSNKCTLKCVFCPKRRDWTVKGHMLRHEGGDPSEADVRAALEAADPSSYREVVFCGLGEPTKRYALVTTLARELRARGTRTRLDTDGLASLREGRDVAPELGEAFDAISVSLNAPDEETYARLCPSRYGGAAWEAVVAFLRRAREHVAEVTASVVSAPGVDVEACRRLVEEDMGVTFRVRKHNVVG